MLKCFIITFPGIYLGGVAIIFAKTQKTALKLFNERFWDNGLCPPDESEVTIVEEEVKQGITYFDDGDY